jgi:hypothetical protein
MASNELIVVPKSRSVLEEIAARIDDIAAEPGGGFILLEAMSLDGWRLALTAGIGGGVLLIAEHDLYIDISATGESSQEAAPKLVREALAVSGKGPFH